MRRTIGAKHAQNWHGACIVRSESIPENADGDELRGRDLRQPMVVLSTTVVTVSVLAFLYWARAVVVPIALAIFLAFILASAVAALRRWGLGRVPSVLLVVGAALAVLLLIGGLISWQTASLVKELPDHQDRIHAKLESLRAWFDGESGGRLSSLVRDIEKAINPKRPNESLAVPVEVVYRSPELLNRFESFLGPTIETLVTALFTIVLAAFLLYSREDMRNRILHLLGDRRLTTTTKAIDDAGNRISRYLPSN